MHLNVGDLVRIATTEEPSGKATLYKGHLVKIIEVQAQGLAWRGRASDGEEMAIQGNDIDYSYHKPTAKDFQQLNAQIQSILSL